MPRSCLLFVGMLVWLSTASVSAQPANETLTDMEPPMPALERQSDLPQEITSPAFDEPTPFDIAADAAPVVETPITDMLQEFHGYRYHSSGIDWMIGNGNQFGMVSLASNHYQHGGVDSGIGVGMQFHFLAGPVRTDMPPRVFDFSIGYQQREVLGDLGYDVAVAVMASSDFEGSSREGIRFPSHAVGFLRVNAITELVFGVDYLDRGDIKILPVGGLIVLPHPDVRFELVFPRPRMVFRLTDKNHLSIAGELGGGTWAIERDALFDDLTTYRDLRLSVGLEHVKDDGKISAFEIAWLFDRRIEYTSGVAYGLNDTIMLRMVESY